ncbi:MAG TPA: hypothetical protein VG432_08195 [Gemmatimonadaceae bacterium]|nr:hypothetical protein [Gemmatimonadaceae bacterium]
MIRPRETFRRFGRAFVALAVMVGVLFTPVERLLPDVHDGDACATIETASWSGEVPVVSAAQLASADGSGQGDQRLPLEAPIHTSHVDHCAHAHLLTLAASPRLDAEPVSSPGPFELGSRRPASITLAPHQRPPIA